MSYTIIIPIFNEERTLKKLLKQLKPYYKDKNEIIIINDGSNDNTYSILNKCNFIKSIHLEKNFGKGIAIRFGLLSSKNEKVVIFDGDLELNIQDISKLMILDKKNGVISVLGQRFKKLYFLKSGIDWGNFIFTSFFNFIHSSSLKDVLCCAKSFYKNDIPVNRLKSKGFDIDIEIASYLLKNQKRRTFKHVLLEYKRRSIEDGKKLKILDGWTILVRIFSSL